MFKNKKILYCSFIFCIILFLNAILFTGCTNENSTNLESEIKTETKIKEVDLTKLNSTMVYSQVYDMLVNPNSYIGAKVKMKGNFSVYEGPNRNYYACLIADATACCSQGIEFELKDNLAYPDDYPELGAEIVVSGIFNIYDEIENENTYTYCTLLDAVFE